jgi:hypothetical protein
MVTADLLSRARAGDGEAFRELAGPHRPGELDLPAGLDGHRGARRDPPDHGRDGLNASLGTGVSDVV